MANTWLYTAGKSYASAEVTWKLASEYNIVWRSFYKKSKHKASISLVRDLRAGDFLFLGYRKDGKVVKLGKMLLAQAAHPIKESEVFEHIPDRLVPIFKEHRYKIDPHLKFMVGLAIMNPVRTEAIVLGPAPRDTLTQIKPKPSA